MIDSAIGPAAAAIARGGVVAFPTETYYGLGADPRRADALRALLRLKGRGAAGKPLLLLAASLDDIAPWIARFPAGFEQLAAHFWPGPLTLVLPAADGLDDALVGPSGGVALRLTSHPVAQALIRACGTALTGTSANRAGQPPPRDAGAVLAAFGDRLAAVLDGGETPGGPPSTLLQLNDGGARLLRAGAVSAEALAQVVGEIDGA